MCRLITNHLINTTIFLQTAVVFHDVDQESAIRQFFESGIKNSLVIVDTSMERENTGKRTIVLCPSACVPFCDFFFVDDNQRMLSSRCKGADLKTDDQCLLPK